MGALDNKFLRLNPGVVLTPVIEPVIVLCDPFFQPLPRYVTSGKRFPEGQLQVIRDTANALRIDTMFPEFAGASLNEIVRVNMDGRIRELYAWQRTWSMILSKGDLVAPPLDVECLFDYNSNGHNKKGELIHASPHLKGTAFDIGCRGTTPEAVAAIMQKALAAHVPGLHSIQVEHNQSCVHTNCQAV